MSETCGKHYLHIGSPTQTTKNCSLIKSLYHIGQEASKKKDSYIGFFLNLGLVHDPHIYQFVYKAVHTSST